MLVRGSVDLASVATWQLMPAGVLMSAIVSYEVRTFWRDGCVQGTRAVSRPVDLQKMQSANEVDLVWLYGGSGKRAS